MNRMLIVGLLLSATLLAYSHGAFAQVFSGADQERRVRALETEIHWYKSMTQAEQEAKKEHKMIFWVHMLGDMDGTT